VTRESTFVSIKQLAECTVRKSKETRPLPATYQTLFEAALFGSPVPQKMLAAVITRQSLELATGTDKNKGKEFENRLTARTALIQAFFVLTKGEPMTEQKQNLESNPGYLCGRLLAFLDRIHVVAHRDSGGTNSSPANRSYGAASTTPALIFPQLCKLVRYHLNKIGGGFAYRLEYGYDAPPFEGLAAICAKLRTSGAEFPRTLSLVDQGRFAIGFYYERCRPLPTKVKDEGQTKE
jgi:CRISPR-associated protein Csd1